MVRPGAHVDCGGEVVLDKIALFPREFVRHQAKFAKSVFQPLQQVETAFGGQTLFYFSSQLTGQRNLGMDIAFPKLTSIPRA